MTTGARRARDVQRKQNTKAHTQTQTQTQTKYAYVQCYAQIFVGGQRHSIARQQLQPASNHKPNSLKTQVPADFTL